MSTDARARVTPAHVAHRTQAATKYIQRITTTWPHLPLETRRRLADMLLAEPEDDET
ncbi:hypothetical protein [Geodermatophilus ruber]|uniref:Uncharacterized protein n=1 Tax=Geodermatophilus ruber TaxID=504800 RepID=A0A1I3Z4W9_9ACTN|nr:hypothetical protein [Geodermatophilus ruber]SFK38596.1 hypothetical protein SAMN04488085_101328 [Geodermatophilus ruber]